MPSATKTDVSIRSPSHRIVTSPGRSSSQDTPNAAAASSSRKRMMRIITETPPPSRFRSCERGERRREQRARIGLRVGAACRRRYPVLREGASVDGNVFFSASAAADIAARKCGVGARGDRLRGCAGPLAGRADRDERRRAAPPLVRPAARRDRPSRWCGTSAAMSAKLVRNCASVGTPASAETRETREARVFRAERTQGGDLRRERRAALHGGEQPLRDDRARPPPRPSRAYSRCRALRGRGCPPWAWTISVRSRRAGVERAQRLLDLDEAGGLGVERAGGLGRLFRRRGGQRRDPAVEIRQPPIEVGELRVARRRGERRRGGGRGHDGLLAGFRRGRAAPPSSPRPEAPISAAWARETAQRPGAPCRGLDARHRSGRRGGGARGGACGDGRRGGRQVSGAERFRAWRRCIRRRRPSKYQRETAGRDHDDQRSHEARRGRPARRRPSSLGARLDARLGGRRPGGGCPGHRRPGGQRRVLRRLVLRGFHRRRRALAGDRRVGGLERASRAHSD